MAIVLGWLLALLAQAPEQPVTPAPASLVFDSLRVSFGEAYVGSTVEGRFVFENQGTRPVRILQVTPASSLATAEAVPAVVPPGGRGEIRLRQGTAGRLGEASFRLAVAADDRPAERKLLLTGFLQSAYDPEEPELDFGQGSPGAVAERPLFSREVDRLEVLEVSANPPFLEVDTSLRAGVAGEGVALRLTLAADAPLGYSSGELRLRTNVPQQPELVVRYRGSVFEDVVVQGSPVDLGLLREGEAFEKDVLLTSRSGAAFQIQGLSSDRDNLTATEVPCPESAGLDPCRAIRLRGTARGVFRSLAGDVTVRLAPPQRPLAIRFHGIVVAAGTRVKSLGELSSSPGAPAVPERRPVGSEVASTAQPVLGKPGIREARLTWQAVSEESTYGYLVYRADRREGPFRRVSSAIIRVPVEGAKLPVYTFVDTAVAPGKTYFYYLESVTRAGKKTRLSGVVAKTIASDGH